MHGGVTEPPDTRAVDDTSMCTITVRHRECGNIGEVRNRLGRVWNHTASLVIGGIRPNACVPGPIYAVSEKVCVRRPVDWRKERVRRILLVRDVVEEFGGWNVGPTRMQSRRGGTGDQHFQQDTG